jgi:hypothetical protein
MVGLQRKLGGEAGTKQMSGSLTGHSYDIIFTDCKNLAGMGQGTILIDVGSGNGR